jgi:hypothetical protein
MKLTDAVPSPPPDRVHTQGYQAPVFLQERVRAFVTPSDPIRTDEASGCDRANNLVERAWSIRAPGIKVSYDKIYIVTCGKPASTIKSCLGLRIKGPVGIGVFNAVVHVVPRLVSLPVKPPWIVLKDFGPDFVIVRWHG